MFIDSHCHLNYAPLNEDLGSLRSAMAQAHVDKALVISTTLETFDDVHQLAMSHDNFWCTVGVHPDEEGARDPSVEELVSLAARPRVVGIGETGLDYYRLNGRSVDDMAWQQEDPALQQKAELLAPGPYDPQHVCDALHVAAPL